MIQVQCYGTTGTTSIGSALYTSSARTGTVYRGRVRVHKVMCAFILPKICCMLHLIHETSCKKRYNSANQYRVIKIWYDVHPSFTTTVV